MLLDHLPADVDGLPIQRSPESDAVAAADPVVVENAEAVVTALAIDPADGEFAHATLVRLEPGAFSTEFFRDWRDTFDAGACSQAGELVRTAEAEIGGLQTFIGTCSGGAHTYHAWLDGSRTLVSITAIGERRLGERLVEALEE